MERKINKKEKSKNIRTALEKKHIYIYIERERYVCYCFIYLRFT